MQIQELETEKIEALRVLANANVKVGEAKGALANVKLLETAYLEEREKRAVAVVEGVLNESQEVLGEALKNYQIIKDIGNTTSSFAGFLVEMHDSLKGLIESFNKKAELWEASAKEQSEKLAELRNQIKIERSVLENDKQALVTREEQARQADKRLKDERQTLDRAITRLKEGKI